MQNVNFYKKFNIHRIVTESHLPVKKVQKPIYSIIEFINQGNRTFLQGDQKTSSAAALAYFGEQPLLPHLQALKRQSLKLGGGARAG